MSLIAWLVIGAIAGWLAGNVMKGGGFGLIGNIAIGLIGSVIGGFLLGGFFTRLGIIGDILTAAIGAAIVLFVVRLFVKR